jgi:hypothetical protein
MTLVEALENIGMLDAEATIYASEPWSPLSRAVIAVEPDDGSLPVDATTNGCRYFLEVAVAADFLSALDQAKFRTKVQRCERVVEYAKRDA